MFMEEKPEIKKVTSGLVIGAIVIGLVIYGGYRYSQKTGGRFILPRGANYTGKESGFTTDTPPTAPLRFTAAADVAWTAYSGKIYNYSFSYPQTLALAVFPNDKTDSVAISWGNIPAENNILLNLEFISQRDAQYVGNVEEYARNWWKFFSGLKGVSSVDKFTNANGLTGYKAVYINTADQTPNVDVFLEVPENRDLAIHIANGVLDPAIFNRIVDSIKWETIKPTATSAPTE
jgi:hypothetical protein